MRGPQPVFARLETDEVSIHYAAYGDPAKPLILCLHGFPEYWAAWKPVMELLCDRYFLVAPDQRGFNLSSKPAGVASYQARHLVRDMQALVDHLAPKSRFILAGHDWGASVAYAFAFRNMERLSHLIIANGAHPACFQRAILDDLEQRKASQYINRLRQLEMTARMSENDFARTFRMIAGFSKTEWMTPEDADGYRAAWSQPGAMEAMLNWYRASPIIVPEVGATAPDAPVLSLPVSTLSVSVPHLVIWGGLDDALRPSCIEGLDDYAHDLTIHRLADAGHWILHEKAGEVAAAMAAFLNK